MRKLAALVAAIAAATAMAALAGCGGGKGASSVGSTRANVFITDSPREDYGHIWATIYHVDLLPQSGVAVAVFDDAAGKSIDLRTLRDSSGQRFSFLGSATIPEGTYTGAAVTLGETMQLIKVGETSGTELPVDSTLERDASNHPVATLTFRSPKVLGASTDSVVIDFDLAHFVVRASGVLPAVQEGDPGGIGDPERHNPDAYRGVVSSLTGTAPDLTFTLTDPEGQTVTVVTTASTALYGSATLADGAAVVVDGTLDTTTGNLVATRLHVCPALATPPAGVFGTASELDATTGTFTVTVVRAMGFLPGQTTVKVVTTSSTLFRADGGATQTQADFFTALAATPTVHVDGTYDSATNTLTATDVKVVDTAQDGGWQSAPHQFRPGVGRPDWGHGVLKD